jgi:hypothetical protein
LYTLFLAIQGENMANISKVLLDIPADKGVHVKSAGAKCEKYVYQ